MTILVELKLSELVVGSINEINYIISRTAPPHSPQVTLTATTTNSLTMKLRPHATDNAPIHGYTIHYKPEFGDWETVQISSTVQKYTLENLWCGSRYQIYVTAYNG